jgi:nicastrin
LDRLSKRIVFSLFNAEGWGFSGSRRFLRDMKAFNGCKRNHPSNEMRCEEPYYSDMAFQYVKLDRVDALIELGQLLPNGATLKVIIVIA